MRQCLHICVVENFATRSIFTSLAKIDDDLDQSWVIVGGKIEDK